MHGGQARQDIEGDSAWESGPLPLAELRAPSAVPESATRLRRSEADTMPVSDPFTALAGGRPDWCVDVGPELRSMTTFDLWSAIERAEIAPWMRVWREGMECWTPVRDVDELRWAVSSAAVASPPPPPGERTGPMALPLPASTDDVAARLDAGARVSVAPSAATSDAHLEQDLPLREPSRGSFAPSLPEPTPTPVVASRRPAELAPERGHRWLAMGSAVAAIAVLAALAHVTRRPAPLADRASSAHAAQPHVDARATQVDARATQPDARAASPIAPQVRADEATASTPSAPIPSAQVPVAARPIEGDEAPPEGDLEPRRRPHREERGQRRLPRGGRAPDRYGR